MHKICVYPWYHSQCEMDVIEECEYPINKLFETDEDPFDIMKKLYLTGRVSVAILKFGSMMDDPTYTICVSDSVRFGQR